MRKIILSFLFLYTQVNYCQEKFSLTINIEDSKFENDSLVFLPESINSKYFEKDLLANRIKSNKVNFNINFSYPQMYFAMIVGKDKRFFFNDYYFIENNSKEIKLNQNSTKNFNSGTTSYEYENVFLKFMLKDSVYKNVREFMYSEGDLFDSKLNKYLKLNPNSYVGLWFLIKRFTLNGYDIIYDEMLNDFSEEFKKNKLWKIINNEMALLTIKTNKPFPKLVLKNINLLDEQVSTQNSKYTLIDFWFSRCKPCLEQLPSLIEIYNNHNVNGFNVVGISVDRTENIVQYWQKRVLEYKIPWENYLDENGTFSSSENIISFPTNFLIDENGIVIKKNVSIIDLEKFLQQNLKE
jgi:thiol-disulfide isomerase/thioredoxin